MKGWKKCLIALVLGGVLMGGSWAGLLAHWHSAEAMGHPAGQLPRLTLQSSGGLKLALGEKKWELEEQKVRDFFERAGRVEWLVPRNLRVGGLMALTGLFWAEEEYRPAAGKKLLVGAPAAPEGEGTGKKKY